MACSTEGNPRAAEMLCLEVAGEQLAKDWAESKKNSKEIWPPAPTKGGLIEESATVSKTGRVQTGVVVNPWTPTDVQNRTIVLHSLSQSTTMTGFYEAPATFPRNHQAAEYRSAASLSDHEGTPVPRVGAAGVRNPEQESSPLLPCLFVDFSSIHCVRALDVQPGEKVLDLSAGIGSKALPLAYSMFANSNGSGLLVCNEPRRTHRAVLEDMLYSFLPSDRKSQVVLSQFEIAEITSSSAQAKAAFRRFLPFDKVLVDVPISKEIAKKEHLIDNYLRCAAELVKPGGLLVYAVSAVDDRVTDTAVRKFLKRGTGQNFRWMDAASGGGFAFPGSESTPAGQKVQKEPHGPLFVSKLIRVHDN